MTKISLVNNIIKDYWDNYSLYSSSKYQEYEDKYCPIPFHYVFKKDNLVIKRDIYLSLKEDMSDSKKYVSYDDYIDIEDLYGNTDYYLRVDTYDKEGNITKGNVELIHTLDYPRTIYIDGVSNTRDIGGLPTGDGQRVVQGKVYRGANLDDITPEGIKKIKELGIKTILDLREDNHTPKIEGINYIKIEGVTYFGTDMCVKNDSNKNIIKKEIEVFANPSNYPIYVHCVAGRDRTGTLIILLLSLLGVDRKNIIKEYELSFFSKLGYTKDVPVSELVDQADDVINYIISKYTGESLMERTKKWLIKDIGVNEEEIKTIESIINERL